MPVGKLRFRLSSWRTAANRRATAQSGAERGNVPNLIQPVRTEFGSRHLSIARGDHAPATAIAAGAESFGYGLLEAYLRTQQEPTRPIVYVYADAPAPHPLGRQPGDPEAVFAIGLLIDRDGPIRLHTRICPSDEPETNTTLQANACRQALEKGVADWTDGHRHWHWTLQ
ncbi:MAG: beta-ketoacyl synthase chain length factor [Betaproteobacteria bacterium]|nr:beta-ketoacyl synthase chain length factor [Betaproteobacteria bacterium]